MIRRGAHRSAARAPPAEAAPSFRSLAYPGIPEASPGRGITHPPESRLHFSFTLRSWRPCVNNPGPILPSPFAAGITHRTNR